MTTATLQKYPLISEVWPEDKRAGKTGTCPWLMATCGTCMYQMVPEDCWRTGDYRSYCTLMTKERLKEEAI